MLKELTILLKAKCYLSEISESRHFIYILTHITVGQEHELRANWISQVCQAPFSSKARVMRRYIIAYKTSVKKNSNSKLLMIENVLTTLEKQNLDHNKITIRY